MTKPPERVTPRVPRWLVAVVVAETALAVVLRGDGLLELVRGEELDGHRSLQLLGLLLAPLLGAACFALVRLAGSSARELDLARQHMTQVLDIASEWIWTIDLEGHVLESNGAVWNILGYSSSELIGTSAVRLIAPESRQILFDAMQESAEHGRGWRGRTGVWQHRDGSLRHLMSSATPVTDDAGRTIGFRGASRDVTFEAESHRSRVEAELDRRRRSGRVEQILFDDARLRMVFQPIVGMSDRRVTGVEALARFTGPPDDPPDVWFREAGELGFGVQLEVLAIEHAAAAFPFLTDDQYLSVNVSPLTLCSRELADLVRRPTTRADKLVVEVTEHAAVGDYGELIDHIGELRRHGVRIAVDDAGAGYASLRHILRLKPDFIKLDRAITATIGTDPIRRALASALVTFASETGAVLVAEGVEQQDEADALRTAGVRHAQGFHYARPAPLATWARGGRLVPLLTGDRDPRSPLGSASVWPHSRN